MSAAERDATAAPVAHVAVSQGARQYMEDTHLLPTRLAGRRAWVAGVFDGHGGAAVAETCRANFAPILAHCMQRQPDTALALRDAFRLTDELVARLDSQHVGSTAVLCVEHGGRLWFANAGDSMAMAVFEDGTAALLSQEHKAHSERERIEAAGGAVTYHDGVGRVNGGLNLSRSIGDHYVKRYVRSEPYVRCLSAPRPRLLVLASDGVWDVYDAPSLARELLGAMQATGSWREALTRVVQASHARGSMDNVTLMVVPLHPAAAEEGPTAAAAQTPRA